MINIEILIKILKILFTPWPVKFEGSLYSPFISFCLNKGMQKVWAFKLIAKLWIKLVSLINIVQSIKWAQLTAHSHHQQWACPILITFIGTKLKFFYISQIALWLFDCGILVEFFLAHSFINQKFLWMLTLYWSKFFINHCHIYFKSNHNWTFWRRFFHKMKYDLRGKVTFMLWRGGVIFLVFF